MVNRTILVVDDEPNILTLVQFPLEREGYHVLTALNGMEALELFRTQTPDLVVLDLMLPSLSGLEVLRQLRQESNVPVMMLTARKEEVDRIVGLEMGADDYVVKPFSVRELVARIKAILRRNTPSASSDVLSMHGLTVEVPQHLVSYRGEPRHITRKEFEILTLLLSNPGRVFTRQQLLTEVWGYEIADDTRTVNVHIKNLREKLKEAGDLIETVRGVGYRFKGHGTS